MAKGTEGALMGEAMAGKVVMAVNVAVVVAATDTADQHQLLSIVVYTIIIIEMMVYATLNLCKIVLLMFFFYIMGKSKNERKKNLQFS